MRFFVRAVATGFALSMGGALFKKVSGKLGLDSDDPKPEKTPVDETELNDETGIEDETETRLGDDASPRH